MSGERGAADHPAADERADRDALIAMQNWDAAEDDARPAAEAGRADEDVYAGPIRAMLAPYSDGIGTLSYERMFAAYHAAGDYRRLIDAARAPLLAELAEAREVYEAAKHAGNARAAQLVWQRDGETARAAAAENQLAEVTRERDEARTEHTWVNATRRADALAEANETLAAQVERLLRDHNEAHDAGIREGREAAARDIRDRADTIDVEPARVGPRATLRRHLWAAANIAAGPPTPAEVIAGLDNAIVCRTRDIEPATDDGSGT